LRLFGRASSTLACVSFGDENCFFSSILALFQEKKVFKSRIFIDVDLVKSVLEENFIEDDEKQKLK